MKLYVDPSSKFCDKSKAKSVQLLPLSQHGLPEFYLHPQHVLFGWVYLVQYSFDYQGFLYIFGSMAWYLSALVLRREQQRNMAQSIWIHRLFWILAGTFSVYKMFEDYFLPLNLIVNILLIMSKSFFIQRTSFWQFMESTGLKTLTPCKCQPVRIFPALSRYFSSSSNLMTALDIGWVWRICSMKTLLRMEMQLVLILTTKIQQPSGMF